MTDKTTNVDSSSLQQASAVAATDSNQSVIAVNRQSSADNTGQSVGDVMVDELSVVIPSSCDNVSLDDERYMSGQCTLLELIAEANNTAMQQQQQQEQQEESEPVTRERALGVSDIDICDSPHHAAVVARPAAAADKTSSSRRLIAVVSDDTVQFIGAKEKLRRQLSYTGHFYRSVSLQRLHFSDINSINNQTNVH